MQTFDPLAVDSTKQFVTTDDGVRLAVRVEGSGPMLVLVHGLGGAKEDFDDHVGALALRHTVVTFDHRGHGESDKPGDVAAYSFDRLVADIHCVLDAIGAERVSILGHSMGGMVVRRFVLSTDRVDALVLMDTCGGPIDNFDPELLEIAAGVALNDGKDALKALLDMADPLGNPAYERLLVERDGYRGFVEAKWASISEVMWAALIREIAYQPDDMERLAAMDLPTLILVGALDTPFLVPAQRLHDAIAGSTMHVIDNAGHSPQFENGPQWFDAMSDFLATVPRRATGS